MLFSLQILIKIIFCMVAMTKVWSVRFIIVKKYDLDISTGDPLHSWALAHSRAPLFTQLCPHCSHSRAPGEQWARLCVFTLHGCVQAVRLCRGSPVIRLSFYDALKRISELYFFLKTWKAYLEWYTSSLGMENLYLHGPVDAYRCHQTRGPFVQINNL